MTRKSNNFQVSIPGNQLTSGYHDPEINWFQGNDTRKFAEFCWEDLLNFAQISRKIHKSCIFKKFPVISTRKSINFRATRPGNQLISGSCYSGIATKKTYFCEYLRENKNIFENLLGYCSRAQVLSVHEKNQSSKISCYSPFNVRVMGSSLGESSM